MAKNNVIVEEAPEVRQVEYISENFSIVGSLRSKINNIINTTTGKLHKVGASTKLAARLTAIEAKIKGIKSVIALGIKKIPTETLKTYMKALKSLKSQVVVIRRMMLAAIANAKKKFKGIVKGVAATTKDIKDSLWGTADNIKTTAYKWLGDKGGAAVETAMNLYDRAKGGMDKAKKLVSGEFWKDLKTKFKNKFIGRPMEEIQAEYNTALARLPRRDQKNFPSLEDWIQIMGYKVADKDVVTDKDGNVSIGKWILKKTRKWDAKIAAGMIKAPFKALGMAVGLGYRVAKFALPFATKNVFKLGWNLGTGIIGGIFRVGWNLIKDAGKAFMDGVKNTAGEVKSGTEKLTKFARKAYDIFKDKGVMESNDPGVKVALAIHEFGVNAKLAEMNMNAARDQAMLNMTASIAADSKKTATIGEAKLSAEAAKDAKEAKENRAGGWRSRLASMFGKKSTDGKEPEKEKKEGTGLFGFIGKIVSGFTGMLMPLIGPLLVPLGGLLLGMTGLLDKLFGDGFGSALLSGALKGLTKVYEMAGGGGWGLGAVGATIIGGGALAKWGAGKAIKGLGKGAAALGRGAWNMGKNAMFDSPEVEPEPKKKTKKTSKKKPALKKKPKGKWGWILGGAAAAGAGIASFFGGGDEKEPEIGDADDIPGGALEEGTIGPGQRMENGQVVDRDGALGIGITTAGSVLSTTAAVGTAKSVAGGIKESSANFDKKNFGNKKLGWGTALVQSLKAIDANMSVWNPLKLPVKGLAKIANLFEGPLNAISNKLGDMSKWFKKQFKVLETLAKKGGTGPLKKIGIKLGAKLAKLTACFLAVGPGTLIGAGLLLWDIGWIIKYWLGDGMPFIDAVLSQIVGLNREEIAGLMSDIKYAMSDEEGKKAMDAEAEKAAQESMTDEQKAQSLIDKEGAKDLKDGSTRTDGFAGKIRGMVDSAGEMLKKLLGIESKPYKSNGFLEKSPRKGDNPGGWGPYVEGLEQKKSGGGIVTTNGLDKNLVNKINKLGEIAYDMTGKPLKIASGKRTHEQQVKLWQDMSGVKYTGDPDADYKATMERGTKKWMGSKTYDPTRPTKNGGTVLYPHAEMFNNPKKGSDHAKGIAVDVDLAGSGLDQYASNSDTKKTGWDQMLDMAGLYRPMSFIHNRNAKTLERWHIRQPGENNSNPSDEPGADVDKSKLNTNTSIGDADNTTTVSLPQAVTTSITDMSKDIKKQVELQTTMVELLREINNKMSNLGGLTDKPGERSNNKGAPEKPTSLPTPPVNLSARRPSANR